ncbi:hypothetical protein CXX93_09965 [Gordonia sp. YC-JH1]|nr:hypothetical protein CXX93_09965 [Gordonia sp. YC-JH1]
MTVERSESGEWGPALDRVIRQRDKLEKGVYHLPIRADVNDRTLSDGEWRVIAERVMGTLGIGEDYPWVAVRHADDHIHIALSRVTFDGAHVAKLSWDYAKIMKALRSIEVDHGLATVPMPGHNPDRPSMHERVTTADSARAMRTGETPPRTKIAALVRAARDASAGLGRAAFEAELDSLGVQYRANEAKTGRMNGYSIAAGVDADGEPIWHAASKLARDLSWSKLGKTLEQGTAIQADQARAAADAHVDETAAAWRAAAAHATETKRQQALHVHPSPSTTEKDTTMTAPDSHDFLQGVLNEMTKTKGESLTGAVTDAFAPDIEAIDQTVSDVLGVESAREARDRDAADRVADAAAEGRKGDGQTVEAPDTPAESKEHSWLNDLRREQHAAREDIVGHELDQPDDGLSL